MRHIRFDVDAQGIALITLDHATETVNIVSPDWIEEFTSAVERVANDATIKGAIITSAKPLFMAGADLKFLVNCYGRLDKKDAYAFSQKPSGMHRRMETCGKPFVAAINGTALGGGFELVLSCHHRILVDDPKAVVGLPEVTVGLLPGSGGTQRLIRMIGVEKGLKLLLDGSSVKPDEALKLGIVDQVVPRDQLISAARKWILSNPSTIRSWDQKGYAPPESFGLLHPQSALCYMNTAPLLSAKTFHNYPAPIAILSAVFDGIQSPFDIALKIESKYFAKLLTDPVARNIIRTTFVNKGAAERGARRPAGIPKSVAKKVGVLGAGMMGAGIAYVSALSGIEVVLLDTTRELADKGKAYSAGILKKDIERGRRDQAAADTLLARIKPSSDFADLAGCDLIVEAVFEDVGIKADVTKKAEAVVGANTLIASNTSTLPISELAEASKRPEDFIGLHFFSPVDRMGLVEVILGKKTSQATLARALDFIGQLRKTPIVVNDSRGFYTSRVFQTLIHEGMAMLNEGVAPALIENAAKLAGLPTGPLALLDEVTVELPFKIVKEAEAALGPKFQRPVSYDVMRRMLEELKRPGRKFGGGFYDYPQGAPKRLWPGLAQAFPPAPRQPDVEEMKKRLLYIQALETARCLEEGVLTHAADGDLGSVLGWGFPTYTGGTLSLIDTVGLKRFVAECEALAQRHGARFQPSAWLRNRAAIYE